MSRLDSSVAEANRLAFNANIEAMNQAEITAKWLKDNPQIGQLNAKDGVVFYFFDADANVVKVQPPKQ